MSNYIRKLRSLPMVMNSSTSDDEEDDNDSISISSGAVATLLESKPELKLWLKKEMDLSLFCEHCKIQCPGEDQMKQHLRGKKHLDKMNPKAPSAPAASKASKAIYSPSMTRTEPAAMIVLTTPAQLGTHTYGGLLKHWSDAPHADDDDENDEEEGEDDDASSSGDSWHGAMTAAVPKSADDVVSRIFFHEDTGHAVRHDRNGFVVGDRDSASEFHDAAYFGQLTDTHNQSFSHSSSSSSHSSDVYLNTHEPFCFATVGTQGAGKSHTLACVIESCLIPMPLPAGREVVRLQNPMAALVLHYEQNESSICEATGLISPLRSLEKALLPAGGAAPIIPALPREKMIVLVSPSYYRQRKAFYGDYCIVKPLLFKWASLSADHIKKIMRINESDTQLYVAAMLDLLRKYQRDCVVPDFQGFLAQIAGMCSAPGQASPLRQRIALLESMVAESLLNTGIIGEGADITSCLGPGVLVIADLTDPLLSSEEANGIFQVLTEKFRTAQISEGCGKLLALDEAHKFMKGDKSDGLSNSILTAVRLMRHDGMRVAISTQSPLTLAPELLELVSMAVLHRFHSSDWFSYLRAKIPLDEDSLQEILNLSPGTGLVFASRHKIAAIGDKNLMKISVRPRLTADRGASRKNFQYQSI